MKKIAGLFFLLMVVVSIRAAAQSKDEKQVAAAVETLTKAMIDGNKTVLESIVSDALSYGHSSGKIQNKKEFVEAIASGQSDFVTINLADQTINVKNHTAIVRHKFIAEISENGKPGNVNLGIMLVWVKENGGWKLLGRQAYKL